MKTQVERKNNYETGCQLKQKEPIQQKEHKFSKGEGGKEAELENKKKNKLIYTFQVQNKAAFKHMCNQQEFHLHLKCSCFWKSKECCSFKQKPEELSHPKLVH